jgi:rSAM/selenodomain-associated transferase 1/rSAM/selenodomain-associated transferase 2
MKVKYSVIIPTLNENYFIRKNLPAIGGLRKDIEIIVSDGGSTDETIRTAKDLGAKIINSEKGRGTQLNAGAADCNGDILFFLHADTFIPANTFELLDEFFENENNLICRLSLGFDVDHSLLKRYTFFSKFDTIFTRFGDSGIIVRKRFYDLLGGFKNYFLFEDVDFLKRASKKTKIKLLNAEAKSSARKFVQNGIVKNQIYSFILIIKYFLGTNSLILWENYFSRTHSSKKSSLILFARYPTIGKVKTRLAKDTSGDFARRFYKVCAGSILREISKARSFNKYLFYTEADEREKIMKWAGANYFYALQNGSGLGDKMLNAFNLAFSHYAEKVIIVGTDVPDLNSELIKQAEKKLEEFDLVIGPSHDGGYYLLGMKKVYEELFVDIPWSSNSVFQVTMQRAAKLGLNIVTLQLLRDIDTKKDLDEWVTEEGNSKLKMQIISLKQVAI